MTKSALPATPPHGVAAPDGYLRVTGRELDTVRLEHLLSGLDEDAPDPTVRGTGALAASLAGFTEWVGDRRPTVSIGWDWQAARMQGSALYRRVGPPRSNLMLIDARGRDLGDDFTAVHVGFWVDRQRWQDRVASFLSKMYA